LKEKSRRKREGQVILIEQFKPNSGSPNGEAGERNTEFLQSVVCKWTRWEKKKIEKGKRWGVGASYGPKNTLRDMDQTITGEMTERGANSVIKNSSADHTRCLTTGIDN